jgi:hypothetical protein
MCQAVGYQQDDGQGQLRVARKVTSDGWVEGTLRELKACLKGEALPPLRDDCEFCGYASEKAPGLHKPSWGICDSSEMGVAFGAFQ